MKKYFPVRVKKISFLVDRKAMFAVVVLFLLMIGTGIISVGIGDMYIPPTDVLKALFGYGDKMEVLTVNLFRLPRIIMAALAGMALAISGAILQGIIR